MSKIARINKVVIIALISAEFAVFIGYLVQMSVSGSGKTWLDILMAFGASTVCDVIAVYLYAVNKESPKIKYFCMASLLLFISIVLFLRHNPLIYVIGMPIIVSFGYYNNYKFTLFGCISLLAINTLAVVFYIITVPDYLKSDSSAAMFQITTHAFLLFTLPNSVKFIIDENKKNVEKEQRRADEVAILLDEANASAATSYNKIMASTSEAVNQLTLQSRDMSESAASLRGNAESGKQRVQELVEKISVFKNQIAANAKNADSSISLANKSRDDILKSNEQMQDAIQAINNIQSVSNEIRNINNTIESIAFQTNILALNAAVEAARAGSAGKGFAVVAEEVRSLSGRSSLAAAETNKLLERSLSAVNVGSEDIRAAAQALTTVRDNSQNMMDIAYQIAQSANEQQNMINDVLHLTDNIGDLITTTSSAADKSFDISRIVHDEAESLNQLVINSSQLQPQARQ